MARTVAVPPTVFTPERQHVFSRFLLSPRRRPPCDDGQRLRRSCLVARRASANGRPQRWPGAPSAPSRRERAGTDRVASGGFEPGRPPRDRRLTIDVNASSSPVDGPLRVHIAHHDLPVRPPPPLRPSTQSTWADEFRSNARRSRPKVTKPNTFFHVLPFRSHGPGPAPTRTGRESVCQAMPWHDQRRHTTANGRRDAGPSADANRILRRSSGAPVTASTRSVAHHPRTRESRFFLPRSSARTFYLPRTVHGKRYLDRRPRRRLTIGFRRGGLGMSNTFRYRRWNPAACGGSGALVVSGSSRSWKRLGPQRPASAATLPFFSASPSTTRGTKQTFLGSRFPS